MWLLPGAGGQGAATSHGDKYPHRRQEPEAGAQSYTAPYREEFVPAGKRLMRQRSLFYLHFFLSYEKHTF